MGLGGLNGLEIKVGQQLDGLQSSLELHWVRPVATAARPAVDHVFEPLLDRLDSKVLGVDKIHQCSLRSENNKHHQKKKKKG